MTQPGSPSSPAERDRIIAVLCQHYAHDRLELDEFERRIDQAHRATTRGELISLVADLPADLPAVGESAVPGSTIPNAPSRGSHGEIVGQGKPGLQNAAAVRSHATEVAIWSGRVRKGSWKPARLTRALAFMGGVELDFREAVLPPGETRVYAMAVMGGVDITVPPGVRVETDGFAIMGGFDEEIDDAEPIPEGAPVIRISGFAFMGGVDVTCRYPGETPRQARRRRKEEARRLRKGR